MSEPNRANAKLVKDAKQFQISAKRLDAFQRNQQRNLPILAGIKNLLIAFANGETGALFRLRINSGDLIERYAQTHFRHIAVFDINRYAEHTDIARFELW